MSHDEAYGAVLATILGPTYAPLDIPAVDAAGVYALFLTDPSALPGLTIPASGVLYVGMTESSLEVRNHFAHGDSGFSSPRRTLGALLKNALQLVAIRRGTGPSPRNITNYRFPGDGEQRLSAWMAQNLRYSLARVTGSVGAVERRLIGELQPPLNLTHWLNPQRPHLKSLRQACRAEAAATPHISDGTT